MRLVTYEQDVRARAGVLAGDRILDACDLMGGDADYGSVRTILGTGPEGWARLADAADGSQVDAAIPLADVVLRAPIEDPDKIICLGLNYHDHANESGMAAPERPMLFAKYRNSLIGPTAEVVLPAGSEAVDYEAELAVVIGRPAKDVSAADALDHVAGIMAFNDVSARDFQHATSQWTAGKAIDTFAPCGPSLVMLDEIDDVQALPIRTRVNGEVVQDGSTADMIFSVAATIEFLSGFMTLTPGDIIATGTPAGVGFSRDPQVLLNEGDVVEVEIEGVGLIRNPVVGARVATHG